MEDKDLKTLKQIDVPQPSDAARARAIEASLAAFEQADEKTQSAPQGNPHRSRLMSTFIEKLGEWTMDKRMLAGTAAAALIALPVATNVLWESAELPGLTSSEQTVTKPVEARKVETADEKPAAPVDEDAGEVATGEQPAKPDAKPEPTLDLFKLEDTAPETSATETEADDVAAAEPAAPKIEAEPVPSPQPDMSAKLKNATPGRNRTVGALKDLRADAERQVTAKKARPSLRKRALQSPVGTLSLNNGSGTVTVMQEQQRVLPPPTEASRDKFEETKDNTVKRVGDEPVSTFSIDVDTASYAFVRRNLENGALPDRNAVRVEEMVNYFSYDYPAAETAEMPFKPSVAVYPTPWNQNTMLLHIGIKGHEVVREEKPRSNLVFLIDVSGSMQAQDKLPLLKSAFRLLVDTLEPNDTVSIVTYAGRAGTVLEPTPVSKKAKILAALDQLRSGGSTAGAQGIRQAYALAQQEFDPEGVNRVILATDGDFNVGISDVDQLKSFIETKRKSGVFLSVLGFGQGNYNDHLMQVLAQNGNGNAAYIDSLREAQKVLVEEAGSALFPIASDVKIQVEFNPTQIAEYRLIGYETRALKREDFNNDKVDAGDIGSGHTVTAIYELTPVSSLEKFIDDLRYQKAKPKSEAENTEVSSEYAFLKMRYKLPGAAKSKLFTQPITPELAYDSVDALPADMRFAASVAAFGQKLRGNPHLVEFSYDEILRIASGARGNDAYGYRSEFLSLVRLAKSLDTEN